MDNIPRSHLDFRHLELGDIIGLPDGRAMTARCRVTLPSPVGTMAGFVIAGELEILLASPSTSTDPVGIYTPLTHLPVHASAVRTVHEGVARFWAPHLPSISGAMGELLYRVVEIRGSIDPAVIVQRGQEKVVFFKTTAADPSHLQVMYMPRSADNDFAVARHSGTVDPAALPDSPMHVPEERPLPAPEPVRRRRLLPTRR